MTPLVNTKKIQHTNRVSREGLKLFLLVSPFLALLFVFSYFPLHGWIYAFYDYSPLKGLAKSTFVGLKWFSHLYENPVRLARFFQVLKNTFAFSGLSTAFSWLPVAFAIFLSEIRIGKVKKTVQTLTTLPNYISWVMVYAMAFALFSSDGMLNSLLKSLGFIEKSIEFLNVKGPSVWWTMWGWGVWKSMGWSAIIYLAAIAGIDQELYEAARVDGAGRFRLMWHITVPGIQETYLVLLLMGIASFLSNGFDQYYVFGNSLNMEYMQVLDLYVYNITLAQAPPLYSLATAIGMAKSLISLALLFGANSIAKIVRGNPII